MKKNASTIILILIFFIGLSVLLYPTISNYINELSATRAITHYDETVRLIDEKKQAEILSLAHAYNKELAQRGGNLFEQGGAMHNAYQKELNISGDGMMGYIEIKKLDVRLPILHGTSDKVLQHNAGYLEGSSLPVGGDGTHSVITAHRGLPSAKLFTNLDRLEIGDTFQIIVLKEILTYEVEDISIVLPINVSELEIVPGKDYVTLLTCTPYAVNTHRLLVRGKRIETKGDINVTADAIQIDPLMIAPIIAAPILFALLLLLITKTRGRNKDPNHKKRNKKGEGFDEGL
ncbi:MAG: class C sortase [Clostridiales bacterium]|jgi:sortase A|nr:class C sortase [Clostridiales bacterium]